MIIRIVAASIVLAVGGMALNAESYNAEIASWRKAREDTLQSDTGWLAVAGLFWLKEGRSGIGAAGSNRIVLPAHSSPPELGVVEHSPGKTILHYANGSKGAVAMLSDRNGKREPTRITVGDLTFWVIERGERFGIRMLDKRSSIRTGFTGCNWYPVRPEYRIEAKFVPDAKTVSVPSVIGVSEDLSSPGYVEFELHGETVRLRPTGTPAELFFVFRDGTSGKSTYGASRFLYASLQNNGKVLLDFNKAYNPPCTFTPYATCPLPTRENRIRAPIEAGELKYGGR